MDRATTDNIRALTAEVEHWTAELRAERDAREVSADQDKVTPAEHRRRALRLAMLRAAVSVGPFARKVDR